METLDLTATEIVVMLSPSGPRWVSDDAEFAVWSAALGEERDADPVTLTGPLGHVTPGEQLLCVGGYAQAREARLAVRRRVVPRRAAEVGRRRSSCG